MKKNEGTYEYQYFLKDHLGNTRITMNQNGTVLQEDAYYPFGMNIAGLSSVNSSPENKYKYNGKELEDEFGLEWYDYGARFYDVALGRWHVLDNSAETYFPISPFAYVGNNPLRRIDPNGNDGWDVVKGFAAAVVDNASIGMINLRDDFCYNDAGDFNKGQDAGDIASVLAGGSEAAGGEGLTAGSVVVTGASGGLSIEVTAPAFLVGTGMMAHGLTMAATATANFATQKGRVDENKESNSSAEKPDHQTSSGQATDKHGNKLGPSGKPQINKVTHSTQKSAKDAARAEGKGKPVKHPSPQKGKQHYHPTDKSGNKKPTSTHHEYPQR